MKLVLECRRGQKPTSDGMVRYFLYVRDGGLPPSQEEVRRVIHDLGLLWRAGVTNGIGTQRDVWIPKGGVKPKDRDALLSALERDMA